MKLVVFLVAVLLAAQSAIADCGGSSGSFRKCYDNSNAPPALVYKIFVRHLFSDSLEDEEDQIGWHYVEAGLTQEMSSDDAIRYFVSRFLDIEKEVEETQKRTLCFEEKPRYDGAENFVVFNQLDEIAVNIYEKHLFLARSDLVATGLFNLDKALEEFPGSFTSMFMDHEKAHNGSTQQIAEFAKSLCERSWGHEFSSSRSVSQD